MTSVELFVTQKKGKTLDTEIVTEAMTCVDLCMYLCFSLHFVNGSFWFIIDGYLFSKICIVKNNTAHKPSNPLSLFLSLSLSSHVKLDKRNRNVVLNKARGLSSKLEG